MGEGSGRKNDVKSKKEWYRMARKREGWEADGAKRNRREPRNSEKTKETKRELKEPSGMSGTVVKRKVQSKDPEKEREIPTTRCKN